jgi:hypothetical protein
VHRTIGARLAVPLFTILLLAPAVRQASAVDGCRPGPDGIVCDFRGTATTTTRVRGGALPPLRYLATSGDTCWYWSRYPPGLDAWDSANDQMIILTRFRLPECQSRPEPPITVITSERAWEIFRAFPLDAPSFRLSPRVGITNLPSRLHLEPARMFTHRERLPDGRILEVEAAVATVWIEWSDGTPIQGIAPPAPYGDPGPIRHTYALKTCPPDYRAHHLDGPKCHPSLESYAVTVTFEWQGRYRTGRRWIRIGSIDRSTSKQYDIDEVLGVLVAP